MSLIQFEALQSESKTEALSFVTRALAPGEQIYIDRAIALHEEDVVKPELGIDGRLLAELNVVGKSFVIFDTSEDSNFLHVAYTLIDETFDPESNTGKGSLGLMVGSRVEIGRDHLKNTFDYPGTVSATQFSIFADAEGLRIVNAYPTNPTEITFSTRHPENAHGEDYFLNKVGGGRTQEAVARIFERDQLGEASEDAPYGTYLDHPVIGRESKRINNGVYLGGSKREAILVDNNSKILEETYLALREDLENVVDSYGTLIESDVLLRISQHVQRVMTYDEKKTDKLSKKYYGDQLVGLSAYVEANAGVCRHQALLAAYIAERLIGDGYLSGTVGVERNTMPDLGGTHAWAKYTNSRGVLLVIDPAQNFVGTKEEGREQGNWEYSLDTDLPY